MKAALQSRKDRAASATANNATLRTEAAAMHAELERAEAKSVKLAEALTILHSRMGSLGGDSSRSAAPDASAADSSMLVDAVPAFVELYEELVCARHALWQGNIHLALVFPLRTTQTSISQTAAAL